MPKANALVSEGGQGPERLDDLVIGHRFRGPPGSANGGYTCGRLAHYVGAAATVRLMRPPPLDIHMDVVKAGDEIQLRSGDEVIARAWPTDTDIEVPPAPEIESARARRNQFAGHVRHAFPSCFVCGVERQEGEGLLVHAGPVKNELGEPEHHVACTWIPHHTLCEEDDVLPEHYAWAALDCPSGWSFLSFDDEVALLGELTAEVLSPIHCGEEYIVAGWEIDREGRKRRTGSAIYDTDGEPLAKARATWIVIDPPGH